MAIVEKLDLFHGLNINPIPLEFSQSLTTTEMLGHMQNTLNNLIDAINDFENIAKEYTDKQIKTLKELLELKETELKQLIEVVERNCNNYTDENILIIVDMFNKKIDNINTLINVINATLDTVKLDIETLFNIVNNGSMSVVNPTTGQLSSIQDAINALYNSIRVTLTWEEIDALGMTWEEVENLSVTWDSIEYNVVNALGVEIATTSLEKNI